MGTKGNKIKDILRDRNMKATELAKASGLSDSYLNRVMSGAISNVTLPTAFKISNALDMTVEEIFGK